MCSFLQYFIINFIYFAGVIIKNFSTVDNLNNSMNEMSMNQNASGVINQYKDIIRDQDYKMQTLRTTLKQQQEEIENLKRQFTDLQQTNTQLHDQNILLKAQLTAATSNGNANVNHKNSNADDGSVQIRFYQAETMRLQEEVTNLNEKLSEALDMTEKSLNLTEISKLRKDQEDLLELLTDQVRILSSVD